jgi:flagellar biosynthesis protein FlhF
MQVRVFEATDMASGLKLVKKELGPDALILSTRTIRNGTFGIMGKPILEITAAIDSVAVPPSQPIKMQKPVPQPTTEPRAVKRISGFREVVGDHQEIVGQKEKPGSFNGYERSSSRESETPPTEHRHQTNLETEVNELRDLVKSLAGQIATMSESREPTKQQPQLTVRERNFPTESQTAALHGDYILSSLVARGVNVETARTIARFLRESMTEQELAITELVDQAILDTIKNLIQVAPPQFASRGDNQLRLALVGPTGVGKTTTLAKIAASYLSKYGSSIALITIDTYRIAAVEQLKVYGEIMHLPVEVVISPEQLEKALLRHKDKELILIDTAGRSPRDSECINELCGFLKPELNIDKYLVLSAVTREQELIDAVNRFQCLGISNTIFTKIDECASLGILLNVQIQNANPLSYFTNGQKVPEDLIEATPAIAAELIMSPGEGSLHG